MFPSPLNPLVNQPSAVALPALCVKAAGFVKMTPAMAVIQRRVARIVQVFVWRRDRMTTARVPVIAIAEMRDGAVRASSVIRSASLMCRAVIPVVAPLVRGFAIDAIPVHTTARCRPNRCRDKQVYARTSA